MDYAVSRNIVGSIFGEVIGYINSPHPCSHTMALGLTQPLTEMNTKKLSGIKGRSARKAEDLIAICDPIV
jgi:hypothetical protein